VKQRHYFYLILAFIGELFVIGQWSLFRHSLPIPEMPLLAIFMALPVLYVIPYVFSAVLPPLVTRGLTRFAGYWFSFSYYATMLLIPGLLLWIQRLRLCSFVAALGHRCLAGPSPDRADRRYRDRQAY